MSKQRLDHWLVESGMATDEFTDFLSLTSDILLVKSSIFSSLDKSLTGMVLLIAELNDEFSISGYKFEFIR